MKTPAGLEPAKTVLTVLGGASAAGRAAKVSRITAWRWTQPRKKGGTNGYVPPQYMGPLIEWAEKHDKPLTAAMFVRPVPKRRSKRASQ